MPPHCGTLDGPVVVAARKALEVDGLDAVLPFLQDDDIRTLAAEAGRGIPAARTFTSAMLGFLVWSLRLWCATARQRGH